MAEFTIESIAGPQDGVRILRLTGPFTLSQVREFQSVVRNGADPITLIDLTDVPYMDSASLGSILGVHVSYQRDHRKYALIGVSARHRLLFEVGGLEDLLVIHDAVEDALANLVADEAAGSTI